MPPGLVDGVLSHVLFMNIRYHVTFDDFIATYQINVKGNPSTAKQRMKVLLLLLAITVVCICFSVLICSNLPLYLAVFVAFFTLLVLILSQMKSVVGKNLARFFDNESQKRLAGLRECVIDEKGLVVRSNYSVTNFYWPPSPVWRHRTATSSFSWDAFLRLTFRGKTSNRKHLSPSMRKPFSTGNRPKTIPWSRNRYTGCARGGGLKSHRAMDFFVDTL